MKRLLLSTLLLCTALTAYAADAQLTIDVPAPVKTTITREAGEGKLLDLKRETNDGQTFYIATVSLNAKEYSLRVDASGKLIRKQAEDEDEATKAITIDELPAAVKATLQKEAPGAKINEINRTTQKLTYTVETASEGQRYTLTMDAAGKLITKEFVGPVVEEKDKGQ